MLVTLNRCAGATDMVLEQLEFAFDLILRFVAQPAKIGGKGHLRITNPCEELSKFRFDF